MHRRHVIALLAVLPVFAAAPDAVATDRRTSSDAAFDAAQAVGKPILVEVTAPWCPTCRAQKPHIDAVAADPRMRDVVVFTVDFDSQKDALRRLNVRAQSTLIVWRGREERGRATGVTDGAEIRELLFRAL